MPMGSLIWAISLTNSKKEPVDINKIEPDLKHILKGMTHIRMELSMRYI